MPGERVLMQNCGDGFRRADFGSLAKGGQVYQKTAAYTLVAADTGKTFGVRGAGAGITFTLPAPTKAGLVYFFHQHGGQTITVTATGSAKINNGDANGSITVAGAAPGIFMVVSDGTGWQTDQIASVSATDTSLVAQATVTLTNAEIKALRATPKTLVAAPGAGKILHFIDALLFLDYGSNVLTESADNLAIKYTDGSGAAVSNTIEATGFIDASEDTYTTATAKYDAQVTALNSVNKALVLHNIGDGEYAGNAGADTTMKVFINYRVITA